MNTVRSDVCPGCGQSYPCLNDWVAGRCVDCLRMGHACEFLGHAIARFVRRAEAAGLVEDVKDCANEAVGAAESYSPVRLRHAIERMDAALDRLARLAGGGA